MKIGITGASGFIGKLLVNKHLELGDEIHILSRKIENKIDGVHFHLAKQFDISIMVEKHIKLYNEI